MDDPLLQDHPSPYFDLRKRSSGVLANATRYTPEWSTASPLKDTPFAIKLGRLNSPKHCDLDSAMGRLGPWPSQTPPPPPDARPPRDDPLDQLNDLTGNTRCGYARSNPEVTQATRSHIKIESRRRQPNRIARKLTLPHFGALIADHFNHNASGESIGRHEIGMATAQLRGSSPRPFTQTTRPLQRETEENDYPYSATSHAEAKASHPGNPRCIHHGSAVRDGAYPLGTAHTGCLRAISAHTDNGGCR